MLKLSVSIFRFLHFFSFFPPVFADWVLGVCQANSLSQLRRQPLKEGASGIAALHPTLQIRAAGAPILFSFISYLKKAKKIPHPISQVRDLDQLFKPFRSGSGLGL